MRKGELPENWTCAENSDGAYASCEVAQELPDDEIDRLLGLLPGKCGKRQRCGVCAGCRADNCGMCGQCKDMLQFGGQGTLKQACKWRTCTGIVDPDAVVSTWLLCDRCQKWRIVPDLPGVVPVGDDAKWFCEMNPDRRHNECSVPQQPDDAVLDEAVIAELVGTKGRGEAGDSPGAAEAASPEEADDWEQPPAMMPPTMAGAPAAVALVKREVDDEAGNARTGASGQDEAKAADDDDVVELRRMYVAASSSSGTSSAAPEREGCREPLDSSWQQVDLRCAVTRQRLTDPARFVGCMHRSACNRDALLGFRRCPMHGCTAVVRGTKRTHDADIVRDDALCKAIERVPAAVPFVFINEQFEVLVPKRVSNTPAASDMHASPPPKRQRPCQLCVAARRGGAECESHLRGEQL